MKKKKNRFIYRGYRVDRIAGATLLFIIIVVLSGWALSRCITPYTDEEPEHTTNSSIQAPTSGQVSNAATEPLPSKTVSTTGHYRGERIPIYLTGSLHELFNDSNKYHLEHAQRLGIDPITHLGMAYSTRRPLVHIKTCDLYEVDSLTHSMPYLVPEAAALLADIGREFNDSLKRRAGYVPHHIRVTSLLRTPASVKRLRRVNVNATDSSTHQFGTTFDLSYTHFHTPDSMQTIHDGDLKNLLGEVLLNMRNRGRCLVKYERKTACYHVTVIK